MGPPSHPPLDLDPLHAAAVDAACDLDRTFFERHPRAATYVRPALAHEACVPGHACRSIEHIAVWQLEPGLRARWPL